LDFPKDQKIEESIEKRSAHSRERGTGNADRGSKKEGAVDGLTKLAGRPTDALRSITLLESAEW
jgi:hypothetical protein